MLGLWRSRHITDPKIGHCCVEISRRPRWLDLRSQSRRDNLRRRPGRHRPTRSGPREPLPGVVLNEHMAAISDLEFGARALLGRWIIYHDQVRGRPLGGVETLNSVVGLQRADLAWCQDRTIR